MSKIEGLNTKTYAKGSTFPAYQNDKVRLFNMRFCPYAQRACLALAAKDIPFEVVNIHLAQKPEWYLEKINPLGKVPSIQLNDKVLYESLICSEWADDHFGGNRKLLPQDHYERAKQKMLVEQLSKLGSSLYPLYRNSQDETCRKNVHEGIQLHEDALKDNYFAGKECGWIDYMIWPFIERLEAVALMTNGQVGVTKEKYPKLAAYMERMKQRPEVKAIYRTPEEHASFFKSAFTDGVPNYDIGL
jgi:glutathione S-transferase